MGECECLPVCVWIYEYESVSVCKCLCLWACVFICLNRNIFFLQRAHKLQDEIDQKNTEKGTVKFAKKSNRKTENRIQWKFLYFFISLYVHYETLCVVFHRCKLKLYFWSHFPMVNAFLSESRVTFTEARYIFHI